jgi:zinc protease
MNKVLDIKYEKHKLSNGLEVILYKDNSLPIVSVNLWYRVGSSNEVKGKTGLAHLFEHMMFQGSKNVPKEMHFKYIQEAGGTLNGSTSFDRTNYYETLPSNALELALWLESDRMGFLLPTLDDEKLENQREVVMNERRQRYDNQPYGRAWEILFSSLFPENHPYHWPTIGWMEDIESYTLDDVKQFFKKFYAPDNASIVIAGDIEYKSALELTKKYFEVIKSATIDRSVAVPDVDLTEVKLITHEDNVQFPRLYMMWKSDKLYAPDDAKLDFLSSTLSGTKNSRLYKRLVFEKQIALDVFAFQYSSQKEGEFVISATARPGVTLDTLKEIILNEIGKIVKDGVSTFEIERAKNSLISDYIYSLQNLSSLADQLNNYNMVLGEPNSFIWDLNRYDSAGVDDVQYAASKYLTKPYVELRIVPKNNEEKNA